jgi:hypothetical protein
MSPRKRKATRRDFRGIAIKPKTGYCINCDNKHGCKTRTPPCLMEMAAHGVVNESGKEYLTRKGGVVSCEKCPFFRSCWSDEEYDGKVREVAGRGENG